MAQPRKKPKAFSHFDTQLAKLTMALVKVHQRRRRKPGERAAEEIKKYQKSAEFLLCKAPFRRLVREVAQDEMERRGRGGETLRFSNDALLGIQEIAEAHLVSLFNAAVQSANHAGRQTIMDKDFGLIFEIMTNSFVTQNGGASQGCKLGELKKGDKKKAEDPKMKADQHQQCPETTGAEDEEEEEDDGEYSVANSAGSAGSNESEDSLLGDD